MLLKQEPKGIGVAVVACRDNPWGPLAQLLKARGEAHPLEEALKYLVQDYHPQSTDLEGVVLFLTYLNGRLG